MFVCKRFVAMFFIHFVIKLSQVSSLVTLIACKEALATLAGNVTITFYLAPRSYLVIKLCGP